MANTASSNDPSPTEQIDSIIANLHGWRGAALAQLRAVITGAHPGIVEEVKWKKPSKPEGVPVWVYNGNICIGEALKNAVRLTFPKGALLPDPKHVFNTRLDSKTIRAVDFAENAPIDAAAITKLIQEAVKLQTI